MKALIIATDYSKSFNNKIKEHPNPLTKLFGLSIIEHVILSAKKAGVHEFILVVGQYADKVKAELNNNRMRGVRIRYVEDKESKWGSIRSILMAKDLLKENFIVLMANSIFDFHILKTLVNIKLNSTLVVAIDRRAPLPNEIKIMEINGNIVDIGEDLKKANCVNVGILLSSPRLFSYIEKTIMEGKTKFIDCIVNIVKNGDANIFDIGQVKKLSSQATIKKIEPWWINIYTKTDIKRAKEILLKSVQKRNHFAAYYNAPLEDKITSFISKFSSLTPNRISILTNIFAYCITLLFLNGHLLLASILTFFISILDGVDGKLARLKYMETKIGKLEHSFDFLWEISWIIAFSIALSHTYGSLPLLLCLVILTFDFFNRHIFMQFSMVIGDLRWLSKFDRIFCLIDGRRNTYLWYILIGILINEPIYSLIAILIHAAITSLIYTIRTLKHAHKADLASFTT